jgi:sulfotransferase family protein
VSGPILIGGEHRSGTTLVSVILDSHPDLTVGPELDFLEPPDLGSHVLECCALLDAGDPRVTGPGVRTDDPSFQPGVQFVKQCHRFGVERGELAAEVRLAMREAGGELDRFEDRCDLIGRIGDLRRARCGTRRWGIKIQRHVVRAHDFARIWPDCQLVHVVRDGRDVAASHLRGRRWWGYRDVEHAARCWLEVVEGARDLPTVVYERLVEDPRAALEPLLDELGISWSDALLAHTAADHSLLANPHEHPSAADVSRAIYSEAAGRYRRDLSAAEVRAFEAIAGDALERLGYPLAAAAPR